jgi:hypothetical protein
LFKDNKFLKKNKQLKTGNFSGLFYLFPPAGGISRILKIQYWLHRCQVLTFYDKPTPASGALENAWEALGDDDDDVILIT